MPKVSVIMPTFNRAAYLQEAIESVLEQTYIDYELIIIDDGSVDNTKEVCAKYGEKVRYLYQENKGSPSARNYGISQARGKYIALLDDDDRWVPHKLQIQVDFMEKHPELAFICSSAYVIDQVDNATKFFGVSSSENSFDHLILGNFVFHLTVLAKKEIILEIGGYDTNLLLCQDYDLWLRIAKKHPFCCIDEPLAYYRIHPQNISHKVEAALANEEEILRKKELMSDLPFFRVQHIRAVHYMQFAKNFIKIGAYEKAKMCFLKAILCSPFIGRHFWPQDLQNGRFTFLKRLLRPYCYFFIRPTDSKF